MTSTLKLYSCALSDAPEYVSDPSMFNISSTHLLHLLNLALISPGVEAVGRIISNYDRNFDFGPNIKSHYSAKLGKTVFRFPFQVQVRFGDKGDNLQFRNLVKGLVVSEAVIEFSKR